MEHKVRSPQETTRNVMRARYYLKYKYSYQVIEELQRRGVTDYPAHHKSTSEKEYRDGLIDLLIKTEIGIHT